MVVDIINKAIFPGTVVIESGRIAAVERDSHPKSQQYILPGFIDAHVHIESSMLIPSEFARLATVHGTVATVSDPHEIANVLGIKGIEYMIQNGNQVPFHFYFGASSCVPATCFETAGATITANEIKQLFTRDKLKYLSEMMNYPGVLQGDSAVMEKIHLAQFFKKPVDGYAPGLRGKLAEKYIKAGISTDHECYELDEALHKIQCVMNIIIREGSAAKNYEALYPLIKQFPDKIMFCSDDKHPHELVKGHINELVKRSIVEKKLDLMDVLRAASYNPGVHYQLDVGLLRPGDLADFIIVDNLHDFTILETYLGGIKTAENGKPLIASIKSHAPNQFKTGVKAPRDFEVVAEGEKSKSSYQKMGS